MINKPHTERLHSFSLFSTTILNKIGQSSEPMQYSFKILLQNSRKKKEGTLMHSQDLRSSHHRHRNEKKSRRYKSRK